MKKSSLVLILAAVAAAVAAGAWWRGQAAGPAAAEPAASAPKPAQVVSLATVQRRDMPVSVEAAGTVVPLNTVELRPQISSTVRQVVVKEGQMVRQGELLFRFDDRTEQANLDKARAQLARDQATLADLERQWKRAQELRAQNFISQGAADTVQANLEAQRAAVVADQAAVKAGEVAVSYATLRAPLSGRIGLVNVYPGSLVSPTGATALATIAQIDPIGVSFTLPEAQLGALLRGGDEGRGAQGAKLQVLLPAAGGGRGPNAAPREALEGTVSVIDNAVDTSTGSIRVKGALANPKQLLWPGQYVTVKLTLRTIKDAAVLPVVALVQRGQERLVYVVGADMAAELRPVQLRYSSGEWAVVEGVQPGERVVVEGKQNLRPGGLVREAPAGPAKAASGAASAAASRASA
ncbi:efflux RND transporter periplasmic adaptor subunit [Ideonella sp. 4Y16]|uniref:efflux RND transporter periplasmic adaptor subunit n=1 Tax=Ideonella alba TaxID=2824118 RepID=UPI001B38A80A|nr:efflux RND transporter periplasmic adaptor subunit [Ideonella alba]MBQ0945706.1 efflux RND transporter periplasmic adaptor subunit [Ideonella alba]